MKKRATESSSKTLDPASFSGSICGGPWPSPCIWLPCAGQVTAAGTRRRLAVLLRKCHVSAMLCKGLVTFTWLTRYNVMLKMQTLRDSWISTNHYSVLEMEMVSSFWTSIHYKCFSKRGQNWTNTCIDVDSPKYNNRTITDPHGITTDTVPAEIPIPKSLKSKHRQWLRKQNKIILLLSFYRLGIEALRC